MSQPLSGKVALVTGAARGIGRACALKLAAAGCDIIANYYNSHEEAEDLCAQGRALGRRAIAVQGSVGVPDSVAEMFELITAEFGRLDIVISNAASGVLKPAMDMTLKHFRWCMETNAFAVNLLAQHAAPLMKEGGRIVRDNLLAAMEDEEISAVLDTNVGGLFNVTRPVIPFMMAQRAGRIVNLSSVAGSRAGRGQANYAASKGAVDAVTRALAVELAPRKIQVNAVAPGVIDTEMSQQVRDLADDQVKAKILLRRYGLASEVASAVAFLASDMATYITGQVLYVDGGFKMD